MANRLTMAQINAIVTLRQSEHSQREIARLLAAEGDAAACFYRAVDHGENASR